MRMASMAKAWLSGAFILGSTASIWSAPTVEQMLSYQPVVKGIDVSVPSPADYTRCKVELIEGATKGTSGWILRDPQGRILRKYFDSDGNKYPDQWCYYKDGIEVYRDVDTNANGKPDRSIWLNTGGTKAAFDANEDGVIDGWVAMSQEELSQEVVKAIVTKDFRALKLLLVSDADLKQLGAPAREIERIQNIQAQSEAKFKLTCDKLTNLNKNTRWVQLETGIPGRIPADFSGMKRDLVMLYRGTVLTETAGQHDWIQLGEMVLIGEAWRLIDAPTTGTQPRLMEVRDNGNKPVVDEEMQKILRALHAHEQTLPTQRQPGVDALAAKFYLTKAEIIAQLVAKAKEPSDFTLWIKQLAETLGSAAQHSPASDKQASTRLQELVDQLNKEQPGSPLASYVAFREIMTSYAVLQNYATRPEDMLAAQNRHLERLNKFVVAYPRTEEAADALWQIAISHELQNKETDAKKTYEQIVSLYPASSPFHAKATGALRRLNLEGKRWEINVPAANLTGGGAFTPDQVRSKIVVTYYYANWCRALNDDFAKLKRLANDYRSQGVVFVAVSVDENQSDAITTANAHKDWANFVHVGGGSEGSAASFYGIIAFPHLLLVNREGGVVNRAVDINHIEPELKKLLNK